LWCFSRSSKRRNRKVIHLYVYLYYISFIYVFQNVLRVASWNLLKQHLESQEKVLFEELFKFVRISFEEFKTKLKSLTLSNISCALQDLFSPDIVENDTNFIFLRKLAEIIAAYLKNSKLQYTTNIYKAMY
jgi:hypothetical protein